MWFLLHCLNTFDYAQTELKLLSWSQLPQFSPLIAQVMVPVFPFLSEPLAGPGHLLCRFRLYRALTRESNSAHVQLRAHLEQSFCRLEYNWRLRMPWHSVPRWEQDGGRLGGWLMVEKHLSCHYLVISEHLPSLFSSRSLAREQH